MKNVLYNKESDFLKTAWGAVIISFAFVIVGVLTLIFVPAQEENAPTVVISEYVQPESIFATEANYTDMCIEPLPSVWVGKESFNTITIGDGFSSNSSIDKSLELYRNPSTRAAVEWFYLRVTGNREVTMAILEAADKENIPLSLAFSLAYTESRYNRRAVNSNVNGSVDRGLFQLNNRSFPRLAEKDFFEPSVSARYGMSHLRFCMNIAGNDLTALAMYNAGVTRVRNDNTPKTTLAYVNKIVNYRTGLEAAFAEEVLSFCATPVLGESLSMLAKK